MEHNNQYKSVFLSDVHLGFNGCSIENLEHFMESMSCDNLFLVGDIVDLWAMKDKFYWPVSHQKMLERFINLKNDGVEVFFITGNHDDPARNKAEFEDLKKDKRFTEICTDLENFEFIDDYDYETIKHGKILVIHGDQYDVVTTNAKWISKLGGFLYDLLIKINRPFSKKIKSITKKIVNKASSFQSNIKKDCIKKAYDGLLCGHIHAPEIVQFQEYLYLNTGDWVESCTAVVEHYDGTLELISFKELELKKISTA
tara:strand:+ start:1382 stop:2149 length:768 start_codon:yes stop_codon:yes gene_type:complete